MARVFSYAVGTGSYHSGREGKPAVRRAISHVHPLLLPPSRVGSRLHARDEMVQILQARLTSVRGAS